MSNTADSERWGRPDWSEERPSFWESPSHPGWIALMILGFVFWWPIGLAILAYIIKRANDEKAAQEAAAKK